MCLRSGGLLPISSEFSLARRQPEEYENGLNSEYFSLGSLAPQWPGAYTFLEKPSWYFHFVSDLWLVNKSPGWKRWRTRGPKLILALSQAYLSFINKYLFITRILTCFHSLNNLVDYCGASSVEERLVFQPLSRPNMEITLDFMLI